MVETRAQAKARKDAEKGPAAAAGSRAAAKLPAAEEPGAPSKRNARGKAAAAAVSKKKAAPATAKTTRSATSKKTKSTAKRGKSATKKGKDALDTMADDFNATLPGRQHDQAEMGDSITVAAEVGPVLPSPSPVQSPSRSVPTSALVWVDAYPAMKPRERLELHLGYVCYRTDYSHSDEDWEKYKNIIMDNFRKGEMEAGAGWLNKDYESLQIVWMEDRKKFNGAGFDAIRSAFNEWCLERNVGAPDPLNDPFPKGPYQDFTTCFCLVADAFGMTSTLNPDIFRNLKNPRPGLPHIVIVDRYFDPSEHAKEIARLVQLNVDVGASVYPGEDTRERDERRMELGETIRYEKYKGYLRASIHDWMHIESEAEGRWTEYIQFFAKNVDSSKMGCFVANECGFRNPESDEEGTEGEENEFDEDEDTGEDDDDDESTEEDEEW